MDESPLFTCPELYPTAELLPFPCAPHPNSTLELKNAFHTEGILTPLQFVMRGFVRLSKSFLLCFAWCSHSLLWEDCHYKPQRTWCLRARLLQDLGKSTVLTLAEYVEVLSFLSMGVHFPVRLKSAFALVFFTLICNFSIICDEIFEVFIIQPWVNVVNFVLENWKLCVFILK